jgi:hypothetical protein
MLSRTCRHDDPGLLYFNSVSVNWRNMLGVLFGVLCAIMFLGGVGKVVTFPSECPKIFREYMAGANAIGPYVLSRVASSLAWLPSCVVTATIVFWMAGR